MINTIYRGERRFFLPSSHHQIIRKTLTSGVLCAFVLFTVLPPPAAAQALDMPPPGYRVRTSEHFEPAVLLGLKVNPGHAFRFDFIVDPGESGLTGQSLEQESTRLIKYFLAALTIPSQNLWVNLSPYEEQRVINSDLGQTDMGRDMLTQDYLLKQMTSSLMYPEDDLGKAFWDEVYERAYRTYGTTDIPVDTFNKVWIVPDTAVVYENGNTAVIVESRLKVMLEDDYRALEHTVLDSQTATAPTDTMTGQLNRLGADVVREIVLPVLNKEVNEGKNFAALRQIYQSLILASWYKRALRNSILTKLYADQNKISGVDLDDKDIPQKVYTQYLDAYRTGVFNYIKEDYDPASQQIVPRKYFSGGVLFDVDNAMATTGNSERVNARKIERSFLIPTRLDPADRAAGPNDGLSAFWEQDKDFYEGGLYGTFEEIIGDFHPNEDVRNVLRRFPSFTDMPEAEEKAMESRHAHLNNDQKELITATAQTLYDIGHADQHGREALVLFAQAMYEFLRHANKPSLDLSRNDGIEQKQFLNALWLMAEEAERRFPRDEKDKLTKNDFIYYPHFAVNDLMSLMLSSSYPDNKLDIVQKNLVEIAEAAYEKTVLADTDIIEDYAYIPASADQDAHLNFTLIPAVPPEFDARPQYDDAAGNIAVTEAGPVRMLAYHAAQYLNRQRQAWQNPLSNLPDLLPQRTRDITGAAMIGFSVIAGIHLYTTYTNQTPDITDILNPAPVTAQAPQLQPAPVVPVQIRAELIPAISEAAPTQQKRFLSQTMEQGFLEAARLAWDMYPEIHSVYESRDNFQLYLMGKAWVESRLNPKSKSHKDAFGLMQMRKIAWNHVLEDPRFQDRILNKTGKNEWSPTTKNMTDIKKNTMMGALYTAIMALDMQQEIGKANVKQAEVDHLYHAGWGNVMDKNYIPAASKTYAKNIAEAMTMISRVLQFQNAGASIHIVEDGDTWSKLVGNDTKYEQLVKALSGLTGDTIRIGEDLLIMPTQDMLYRLSNEASWADVAATLNLSQEELTALKAANNVSGLEANLERFRENFMLIPKDIAPRIKKLSRGDTPSTQADNSMASSQRPDNYGGIDLNESNLNLSVLGSGDGPSIPIDADLPEGTTINGLEPFIMSITPVTDVPLLLGIQDTVNSAQISAAY